MKRVMILAVLAGLAIARADDKEKRREQHNYILERQQAYQVEGVPTERMIIGKRQIDIYPNGLMFEGNNVVGVRK